VIADGPVAKLTQDLRAIAAILASESHYSMLKGVQSVVNDPELLGYLFKIRCGFSAELPSQYRTMIKARSVTENFPLSHILSETRARIEQQLVELEVFEDKINIAMALSLLAPVAIVISLLLYSVPTHVVLAIMLSILTASVVYAYKVLRISLDKFLKDFLVFSLVCSALLALGLLLKPSALVGLLIVYNIIENRMKHRDNTPPDVIRYYERVCFKLVQRLNITICPYSVLSSLIDIKEGEWNKALKTLFIMRNGRTSEPKRGVILPYIYTILYRSVVKARDNIRCFLSAVQEFKRLSEKWNAKLRALRLRVWVLGLSSGFTLGIALGLLRGADISLFTLMIMPFLASMSISNSIFGGKFATKYCIALSLAVSVGYYIVKSLI